MCNTGGLKKAGNGATIISAPKNERLQEEKASKDHALPMDSPSDFCKERRVPSGKKGELGAPTLSLQVFQLPFIGIQVQLPLLPQRPSPLRKVYFLGQGEHTKYHRSPALAHAMPSPWPSVQNSESPKQGWRVGHPVSHSFLEHRKTITALQLSSPIDGSSRDYFQSPQ